MTQSFNHLMTTVSLEQPLALHESFKHLVTDEKDLFDLLGKQ